MIRLVTLLVFLASAPALARDLYVPLPPPRGSAATVYALVDQAAIRHGVSPRLARAVAKIESGGRCHVTSSAGARGAMQVKPATARGVGVRGNLHHCATGIEAGMRYLRQALNRTHGDVVGALTLYTRGLAARPVASGYARKVLAAAE